MTESNPTKLLVCITCRGAEGSAGTDVPPPGRVLCDRLEALGKPIAVRPVPVTCFGNCARGCTAVVAAAGKWAYVLGGLDPDHAADVMTYVAAYASSDTGFVGRDIRPQSLRTAIVVRFPLHLINAEDPAP